LNLTLPNTKQALISTNSHIVWGEVCVSFTSARKILRWSGRKDFALFLCLKAICFFSQRLYSLCNSRTLCVHRDMWRGRQMNIV
jgi:hypothetical protein